MGSIVVYKNFSATRQGWSKGTGGGDAFMKLCSSSSGCETRPAQGEPAQAGSEPGDDLRNGVGEAEARERVGHGNAAPKPITFPEAQGAEIPEGSNVLSVRWARRGMSPAGCSTMARTKRTTQAPGRPSPRLDPFRLCGEPVCRLRRTTRLQAHVSSATWHRTSACIEVGHWQGEPEPWLMGAGSRRAA
jgi:hypothetical protein